MHVRGGGDIPLGAPPDEDPDQARAPWQAAPLLAAALVLVGVGAGRAAAATITTVAGGPGTGQATSLGTYPQSVAVQGVFVYVADWWHNVIRRVDTTTGDEIVVAGVGAGGSPGFSGDGGPATAAQLSLPYGVALDAAGNLFIADWGNNRIRRVDAGTGTITTVAGTGTYGFSGDGRPATAAELGAPTGVAPDGAGNLFIADWGNARIRRVDAGTGTITTVAGTGTHGFSGDGGPATVAELYLPSGVVLDGAGNLFIADLGNARIRRVDAATATITTVAGNGTVGFGGDGGPATAAELWGPTGVALDDAGDLFIADVGNRRIRRVDAATGTITTVAGNGTVGFGGDGGPATAAALSVSGVALDGAGNLFIADTGNLRIRRVDAGTGTIMTMAGNGTLQFGGDGGPATAAELSLPTGVALDGAGNIFIADSENDRIRRVDAGTGTITSVAGGGTGPTIGDGGPATAAQLNGPHGIALDGAGNLFIADWGQGLIRRVDAGTGTITTVTQGSAPSGVALDGAGNLFIAEEGVRVPDYYYGARIRRVDAGTGTITTVAGTGTEGFSGDGGPATAAELMGPSGVALDGAGNLFIADTGNARVRRVDAGTGTITTVAGGGTDFPGDGGPANAAAFSPADVTFDGAGNLFIADWYGHRIREVRFCGDGVVDAGEQCDATATSTTTTTTTTTTTVPSCGPAPQAGCQPAAAMKASRLFGKGKLSWRWVGSATVAPSDFGSPPTTTSYLLCVYDRSGLKQSARLPAGQMCGRRPCWKPLGSVGFQYGNEAGTPDGLTRALLEAGGVGAGKIRVKGGGANLQPPALPLTTPMRVQLRRSDGSPCWEATYSTAIRNDATGFTAESDH